MDASDFLLNVTGVVGVGVLLTAGIDALQHARYLRRPRDEAEKRKALSDIFDTTIGAIFIAVIVMFLALIVTAMLASANEGNTHERDVNQSIRECVERGGMPSVEATNWDGSEYEFGGCLLP